MSRRPPNPEQLLHVGSPGNPPLSSSYLSSYLINSYSIFFCIFYIFLLPFLRVWVGAWCILMIWSAHSNSQTWKRTQQGPNISYKVGTKTIWNLDGGHWGWMWSFMIAKKQQVSGNTMLFTSSIFKRSLAIPQGQIISPFWLIRTIGPSREPLPKVLLRCPFSCIPSPPTLI